MGTRYNRLSEVVLTCTHNLRFRKKKSFFFFQFLQLKKISILHGQVFVMYLYVFLNNTHVIHNEPIVTKVQDEQ